jgi:hypothetical protein
LRLYAFGRDIFHMLLKTVSNFPAVKCRKEHEKANI